MTAYDRTMKSCGHGSARGEAKTIFISCKEMHWIAERGDQAAEINALVGDDIHHAGTGATSGRVHSARARTSELGRSVAAHAGDVLLRPLGARARQLLAHGALDVGHGLLGGGVGEAAGQVLG
jgi:hypothetical protein